MAGGAPARGVGPALKIGAWLVMWNLILKRSSRPGDEAGSRAPSKTLQILCLCLGGSDAGPHREELRGCLGADPDWVGLAALANAYLVAPALWLALDRKGLLPDIPDDFSTYLAAIYRANAIRTDAMRRQARQVCAALNGSGIIPLVLKGGGRLFEPEPRGSVGARMMADIDLLVEPPRHDIALAILRRLGYLVVDEPQGRLSHATTLRHSGEPVAIDLHREIGPQRDFIPLADALAAAIPVNDAECRLRLLSPTHRAMHVFFHSQIHDRGHMSGVVPLRHLEDFAWIVTRHATAIDWRAIAAACDALRLHGPWDAWLYLAERCLGVAVAMPVRQPGRARLHYRRCLAQLDHPAFRSIVRLAIAVTEPLSYANITFTHDCGASRRSLLRVRVVETLRLFGKYRHRVPQRLVAAIRDARERGQ